MSKVALILRKYSILVHRWTGVAFCAIFLVWFISGIVMMYWDFPRWTPARHLSRSEAFDSSKVKTSPAEAYERLGLSGSPDRVRMNTLEGRPIYRFHYPNRLSAIYADNGEVLTTIPAEAALRIASAWSGQPATKAEFRGLIEDLDQWTVHPTVRPFGPFFKYSWPNGEEVYVSQITGEVAQHTTQGSRIGAYLGAIPHWFYFTPLRRDTELWDQVVTWTSGIGTIITIFGIVVGIWLYSPFRKRYRYVNGSSSIPYAGQKRWHTMLGLIFGLVTCTWSLSGMLSMSPFPWLVTRKQVDLAGPIRGADWRPEPFSAEHPREALQKITSLTTKEVDLSFVGGEPIYIATEAPLHSVIVPVGGTPKPQFNPSELTQIVARAAQPYALAEVRVVSEYESYYVDRASRYGYPLPVLFTRLDDSEGSMYYVDLRTGRVLQSYSEGTRWNRWLYHGLHSFDLPLLYRYRPAWDIIVLSLMIGGTALSVTSVVIGWRRLKRKTGIRSRQSVYASSPAKRARIGSAPHARKSSVENLLVKLNCDESSSETHESNEKPLNV